MSAPTPATGPVQFILTAPPPVRALAIAAALTVIGAGVVVLASAWGWPVGVAVAAIVLIVLGLGLAVAALVLTARARTVVRADDEQLTVVRAGRSDSVRWASIGEVTLVGPRLALHDQQGRTALAVLNRRARTDPAFMALAAEIARRLDADRGYSAPLG